MPTTSRKKHGENLYLAAYARFARDLPGNGRSWIGAMRQEGIERFESLGFPSTRDEAWRYTNVAPIATTPFALKPEARADALTPDLFEQLAFEPWECTHLVFINGRFSPELSRTRALPRGVEVGSLDEALDSRRELIEPHLGRLAGMEGQAFTALNAAFLRDGAFIHVPKGVVVDEPVHLLFVSSTNGTAVMSHPRNLIVVGEGSQVTVLESYAGLDAGASFTNVVTEIAAGDGAVVDHTLLQRDGEGAYHVGTVQARVGRGSSLSSHVISIGGALIRNDINVVLDGEGADCTLNGLYVTHGTQHVDNHTVIDHARPHGTSRELYKGVLEGRSRGIFDGTVIVRPDAQKTDARQVNRNLLLSDDALVDSKPTLLIRADDVKCSHAATIGQLEEDALFYLRSRGIGSGMARNILIQAFVSEILGRIRIEPVRTGLECLLYTRLHDGHRRDTEVTP
ncbi:MAG: Fe-S cluster assembly protein SufD [Acidobacteriota bacterium]